MRRLSVHLMLDGAPATWKYLSASVVATAAGTTIRSAIGGNIPEVAEVIPEAVIINLGPLRHQRQSLLATEAGACCKVGDTQQLRPRSRRVQTHQVHLLPRTTCDTRRRPSGESGICLGSSGICRGWHTWCGYIRTPRGENLPARDRGHPDVWRTCRAGHCWIVVWATLMLYILNILILIFDFVILIFDATEAEAFVVIEAGDEVVTRNAREERLWPRWLHRVGWSPKL